MMKKTVFSLREAKGGIFRLFGMVRAEARAILEYARIILANARVFRAKARMIRAKARGTCA
ncbi:MAG: hypothetical protein HYZ44_18140 [Bacteroidetes bacterium]|nr:hypothetical protein [Bacteroidota bacterium]